MTVPKFLLLLICLAAGMPVFAQTDSSVVKVDTAMRNPGTPQKVTDSTAIKNDSLRVLPKRIKSAESVKVKSKKDTVFKDSSRLALEKLPRKAVLASAILPGLGQIRNHRWWKVPLIYGGFVGIGLAIDFNNRYYHEFLKEVQYRSEHKDEPLNPKYTAYRTESLIQAKDFYRRNRDLSILGGVAFYAVQMIDAYVDAKFFRFDISDEISLKISPSINTPGFANAYLPSPGLKINLSL
ncbi:DUF5683 domain-containing protein [Rubrolithibacter danxiaensis]|uniref:DUF5683 domain-containing protein n=1 Tax=Rubrolithibacter danxiaensis TaxID=3390805 RepID=UPI003BF79408